MRLLRRLVRRRPQATQPDADRYLRVYRQTSAEVEPLVRRAPKRAA